MNHIKRDPVPLPTKPTLVPKIRVYIEQHVTVKAGTNCEGDKELGYFYDLPLTSTERRKGMRQVQDILQYGFPFNNGENEVIFVPSHQILRVVLSGVEKE